MVFSVVAPHAGLNATVGLAGSLGKAFTIIVIPLDNAVEETIQPPVIEMAQVIASPLTKLEVEYVLDV
jgi:hypothetical protein